MPLNVYQRIQSVMRAVKYVQKDKQVDGAGGGYRAVTHDQVTALVRQHFVDAGIVVVPHLTASATVATGRTTKAGTPIIRFEGTYNVDFVNVDDPADRITATTVAHAEDQGDKAPGKALSYAVKGAILKVLLLETGEDDESRVRPDEPELSGDEASALAMLRDESLNGTAALEKAWGGLGNGDKAAGRRIRHSLAGHLQSLKEAAALADSGVSTNAA